MPLPTPSEAFEPLIRASIRPAESAAAEGLLLFLKAPEPGRVKTRLARSIGASAACGLYRCFVLDTLAMLRQAGRRPILCYTPAHAREALAGWLSDHGPFWPQEGKDLGERMADAFARAFSEGYRRVVLMGTDLPGLPPSVIRKAFEALAHHPAVIGPTLDGGYYLIGFTRDGFCPDCFGGIEWSTPGVFRQTLERMRRAGVACRTLPRWRDIDDGEDLQAFLSRRRGLGRRAPRTLAFLASRGLAPPGDPGRKPPSNCLNPADVLQGRWILTMLTDFRRKDPDMEQDQNTPGGGSNNPNVQVYSLSTCSHCKMTKQLLADRKSVV